jgi:hypothetical protein
MRPVSITAVENIRTDSKQTPSIAGEYGCFALKQYSRVTSSDLLYSRLMADAIYQNVILRLTRWQSNRRNTRRTVYWDKTGKDIQQIDTSTLELTKVPQEKLIVYWAPTAAYIVPIEYHTRTGYKYATTACSKPKGLVFAYTTFTHLLGMEAQALTLNLAQLQIRSSDPAYARPLLDYLHYVAKHACHPPCRFERVRPVHLKTTA